MRVHICACARARVCKIIQIYLHYILVELCLCSYMFGFVIIYCISKVVFIPQ